MLKRYKFFRENFPSFSREGKIKSVHVTLNRKGWTYWAASWKTDIHIFPPLVSLDLCLLTFFPIPCWSVAFGLLALHRRGDSITGTEMKSWEPLTVQPVYCKRRGWRHEAVAGTKPLRRKTVGFGTTAFVVLLVRPLSSGLLPAKRTAMRAQSAFSSFWSLHNRSRHD